MGRPRTSFEMACEDSKNQHTSQRGFSAITLKLPDSLNAQPGSSRKNLRSGSVLIKFYFVQEKPAKKLPAERKQIVEKRGDSKSSEDDVDMHMEITPHKASRQHNRRKLGRRGKI